MNRTYNIYRAIHNGDGGYEDDDDGDHDGDDDQDGEDVQDGDDNDGDDGHGCSYIYI